MGHDCSDTLRQLYEFIDGELTDERRQTIQTHLEDCPPCFEAFDFEAELKIVVASKCKERVPESLRDRIAAAITTAEADPSTASDGPAS